MAEMWPNGPLRENQLAALGKGAAGTAQVVEKKFNTKRHSTSIGALRLVAVAIYFFTSFLTSPAGAATDDAERCERALEYCRSESSLCETYRQRFIKEGFICLGVNAPEAPTIPLDQSASGRRNHQDGVYYETCVMSWRTNEIRGKQTVSYSPVLEYRGDPAQSHCPAFEVWVKQNHQVRLSDNSHAMLVVGPAEDAYHAQSSVFRDRKWAEKARQADMAVARTKVDSFGQPFIVEELNFTPPF